MFWPDLRTRDRQPELMDDPALDRASHQQALKGLERVNLISNIAGVLWRAVRPVCEAVPDRPVRVLDVGCGGGDNSLGLWRVARRAGRDIVIGGCDISEQALGIAAER